MSRWLYQMSEASWSLEEYRRGVEEGRQVRWPTRKVMFAKERPAAGDLIICNFAVAGLATPGICGIGIITKYFPKTKRFDWMPLPPTNRLKRCPWWDDRVHGLLEIIRRNSPRGTMYAVPAAIDEDIRRGMFIWVNVKN